jgi:hypothetical protein
MVLMIEEKFCYIVLSVIVSSWVQK